jgi:RNA polymerase sigma-70 factor (ECF subfamily)
MPATDRIGKFSFVAPVVTASQSASEIEREVIDLFDQFRDPLLRYVLSFGLSMHDAEEVVQDVFLALFRHLQLGKSRSNLRGWIFRVAHNLALKQRIENKKVRGRTEDGELIAERQYDPSPNPEEHLASVERRCRLLAVVDALPVGDQGCLRLRAEGLRYREIASVLGMSLGAVSVSLTRSLARRFAQMRGRIQCRRKTYISLTRNYC